MKPKSFSLLDITLKIILICGVLLFVGSFGVEFLSGKSIYKSPTNQLGGDRVALGSQVISLAPSGNPYKIFLSVGYFSSTCTESLGLFNYQYDVKDNQGLIIKQSKGQSPCPAKSGHSSVSEVSIGSSATQNIGLAPFDVQNSGTYTIDLSLNTGSDSQLVTNLTNFSFEVKKNVLVVSAIFPILGFSLTALAFLGLFIKKLKKPLSPPVYPPSVTPSPTPPLR